jgi:hypothetical protein
MPADFCAYSYFPFRARIPESAKSIDQTNTQILQQQYAPNSGPVSKFGGEIGTIDTTGIKPSGPNTGNSNYPVYTSSTSDPSVSVDCGKASYGCSDTSGNAINSIPAFHIPAFARPSNSGDFNMEIIQPNGDTVLIYQCVPTRDWQTGDVVGDSNCTGSFDGAAYGSIVNSPGINPGNINGGDNFAALPVHYNEVVNGQINHALLVWSGCFTGNVYPGTSAAACKSPPGLPDGVHIWLSLTRAQIDAQPASVIPPYMRVFAYAAHEYGIYSFDTGNGDKWFSQPALEDALPAILSGGMTQSYWTNWFNTNGGGLAGDDDLKLGNTIDWSALAQYLFVLDACYGKGTCSDSILE